MKSLGVIETRGLIAAIQAADIACKTAGVELMGYRKVGAGLVALCLEGEISAVHAAVESGVRALDGCHPARSLVIARPERCVVEKLTALKGYPQRAEPPVAVAPTETSLISVSEASQAADLSEERPQTGTSAKKGKKS